MSDFAAKLKSLREAANLSQSELAEKSKLSKAYVADLEQGRRQPSWATVQTLCAALGVPCDQFMDKKKGKG